VAETTSQLRVQVSTPGLEQARRALEGLSKAASGATGDQAAQFTAATAAVQRMVAAVDQLAARVDSATASFGKMGIAASSGVSNATAAAYSGVVHPGTVSRGNALDVLRGRERSGTLPGMPHMVSSGNAIDILRERQAAGLMPEAKAVKMTTAQRISAGAGAFGIGALQGLMPNAFGFVQRGAGAIPQILGMAAAHTAASFAAAPFRGTQGLVNAVGSIPLVGGLLSAPLSHYASQAERVGAFQRQQMELAPLLGAETLRSDGSMGTNLAAMRTMGPPSPALSMSNKISRDRAQLGAVGNDALKIMGMDVSGGQAFKAALAQTSGLDAASLQATYPLFTQTAMAAQTNLGLSPQTTGQFALGARTNAFGGQRGAGANDMLLKAINQAQQISGSEPEQQNYLRMIAEGIQTFQQTGIPLQMDSIRDLTMGFKGMGMSVPAAERAAMTTLSRATSFGQNGPTSSLDMQILQREGFKGGLPDMLRIKRDLSRHPDRLGADTIAIAGQNARLQNRDIAIDQAGSVLATLGITNPDDVEDFVNKSRSGKTPDLASMMAKAQGAPPTTSGQTFYDAAVAGVPAAARIAAQASNLSVASSMDSSVIAAQLDSTSSDIMNSFARYFGLVKTVSAGVQNTSQGVTGSADSMGIGPPGVKAGN
jgi:hypothetical protein